MNDDSRKEVTPMLTNKYSSAYANVLQIEDQTTFVIEFTKLLKTVPPSIDDLLDLMFLIHGQGYFNRLLTGKSTFLVLTNSQKYLNGINELLLKCIVLIGQPYAFDRQETGKYTENH